MVLKNKFSSVVFIIETKCNRSKMEVVKKSIQFDSCFFSIDSRSSSGGLALFWKQEVDLHIQNFTKWHISGVIIDNIKDYQWLFISFYGHLDTSKRSLS